MSDKQIIDAEFQVAERRLPAIRWGAALRWALWGGIACATAASDLEPALRATIVALCLFWLFSAPFWGLLARPRLSQGEVEPLAARLRANARPGREPR